jgi:hypothetical protein
MPDEELQEDKHPGGGVSQNQNALTRWGREALESSYETRGNLTSPSGRYQD